MISRPINSSSLKPVSSNTRGPEAEDPALLVAHDEAVPGAG